MNPKKRSKFRLFLGRHYYCLRRYLYWMFGNVRFAREKDIKSLAYTYINHKTPLLRKLKDVDMYLQYNKIDNLKIAVKKVNQIVIKPGETFSYWKLIGRTTKRKGYKDGMILYCGKYKTGVGGGLCQLSNLIYWMALHTPLTVVERYRHSYDVFPDSNRTMPFGSGATCVYNYRDLMIKNDTKSDFQIQIWLTKENLCGCIRGSSAPLETYKIVEKNHHMKRELFGAYSRHNELYREVYDTSGRFLTEEFLTENHALMRYEPLLEEKERQNNDNSTDYF